jgi:hypothetical protein
LQKVWLQLKSILEIFQDYAFAWVLENIILVLDNIRGAIISSAVGGVFHSNNVECCSKGFLQLDT